MSSLGTAKSVYLSEEFCALSFAPNSVLLNNSVKTDSPFCSMQSMTESRRATWKRCASTQMRLIVDITCRASVLH